MFLSKRLCTCDSRITAKTLPLLLNKAFSKTVTPSLLAQQQQTLSFSEDLLQRQEEQEESTPKNKFVKKTSENKAEKKYPPKKQKELPAALSLTREDTVTISIDTETPEELLVGTSHDPTTENVFKKHLDPAFVQSLKETFKITNPSDIQRLAIPQILTGKDVLIAAQTGTGKTLSYLLPVIQQMKNDEEKFEKQKALKEKQKAKAAKKAEAEATPVAAGNETAAQEIAEATTNATPAASEVAEAVEDKKSKKKKLKDMEVVTKHDSARRPQRPRCIVFVPTRELATQVHQVIKKLSHIVKVRSVLLRNDYKESRMKRELALYPVDVIVTTPGVFRKMVNKKFIFFSDLKHVIVDEVDTLLSKGFKEEFVSNAMEPCLVKRKHTSMPVQFVFALATYSGQVKNYIDTMFPKMIRAFSPTIHKHVSKVDHQFVSCVGNDKLKDLLKVVNEEFDNMDQKVVTTEVDEETEKAKTKQKVFTSKTLIFCNTVSSCRAVHHAITEANIPAACYHSEMRPEMQVSQFDSFKEGRVPYMISTDIASRGLDLPDVNHVIMFDFPMNVIDYIHRAGRTGRMGKTGKVTSLLQKRDLALGDQIRDAIHKRERLENLEVVQRKAMSQNKNLVGRLVKKMTSNSGEGEEYLRRDFRDRRYEDSRSRQYDNEDSEERGARYGRPSRYDRSSRYDRGRPSASVALKGRKGRSRYGPGSTDRKTSRKALPKQRTQVVWS